MLPEGRTMPNIYQAARIAKGITQERAADAIPCSVRSLADYESGARVPPAETVVRMAEIYCATSTCARRARSPAGLSRTCASARFPKRCCG